MTKTAEKTDAAQEVVEAVAAATQEAAPAPAEKPAETKEAAFVRLANKRTGNALTAVNMMIPLAARNNYTYTTEQTAKIVAALRGKVDELEAAFAKGEVKTEAGFSL